MATKRVTAEELEPFYVAALASDESLGAVERDVVDSFLTQHEGGHHEDRLPMTSECRVVTEMAFRFGRADIVVFHSDGSASVVEAKDGAKGYNHVVSGIGQVGLYATQLTLQGTVRPVRRALLYSSTGDLWLDVLIEITCEQAGVVPLPTGTARQLKAAKIASNNAVAFFRGQS